MVLLTKWSNNHGLTSIEAAISLADEFPRICGCLIGDCLNEQAGEYTCGERWEYVMDHEHLTPREARIKVAGEFPSPCSCLAGTSWALLFM